MDDKLSERAAEIVALLRKHSATLATAESCTGGLIAATLTEAPGASAVFRFGWVTYSAEAKMQELNVPAELISRHTVVSEPVVEAMAAGARKQANADYAVAVSGNAGPTAPPGEPPVGTVCLAIATPRGISSRTLFLPHISRHNLRLTVVREIFSEIQSSVR